MKARSVLVTGAAGFIGAHLCARLAHQGHSVTGCDLLSPSGEAAELRRDRVEHLLRPAGVSCIQLDLADAQAARALLLDRRHFHCVVHLAALAGVRGSVSAPLDYVGPNLVAFANVANACREARTEHLIYASSSSVYGRRAGGAFAEGDRCDRPASFYAATKIANEAMAHAFASVHGMAVTGLRFFTVYGPWGRPDMAYFAFARQIRRAQPITLYDRGRLWRDFTYVDDVVDAVSRLVAAGAQGPGAEVLNVGHSRPVQVIEFVRALESALGLKALIEFAPMQPGDVPVTCADSARLVARVGDLHSTPLADGLRRFTRWLDDWEPLAGSPSPARAETYGTLTSPA